MALLPVALALAAALQGPDASAPSTAAISAPVPATFAPDATAGTAPAPSSAVAYSGGIPVRVGDLVSVRGIRSNMITGFGLVVGLAATGDTANFTKQQIANLAAKLNVTVSSQDLASNNVAIVTVTATLPPYPQEGQLLDCAVSSYGDAKSLVGGLLVRTPMYGAADGPAIAVAQGALVVGGFLASGQAATVQKNHTTAGFLPQGALIERGASLAVQMSPISEGNAIHLDLKREEFQVADKLGQAVNALLPGSATALNSRTVRVALPADCTEESGKFPRLLASILDLTIVPFVRPRIVLNEKTSTVLVTGHPRLGPCLIARGNLTISIAETPTVSQPAPFSTTGETREVPRSDVTATEEARPLTMLRGATTLTELTEALSALGATPRELVDILSQLHAAGALYAEVVIH